MNQPQPTAGRKSNSLESGGIKTSHLNCVVVHRAETPPKPQPAEPPRWGEGLASIIRRLQ